MSEAFIEPEELLKKAGLELNYYPLDDLIAIIRQNNFTEELVNSYNEDQLKEELRTAIAKLGKYDYMYLFFESNNASFHNRNSKILRVALFANMELVCQSLLIDFESNLYYYDDINNIFNFILDAKKIEPLSQDMVEKVRYIIESASWPVSTCNNTEPKRNNMKAWGLSIETSDGIINYSNLTVEDIQDLKNLTDTMYTLFSLFWD